tara:strand:- start:6051 stop:6365 length:315 start_codon:yes stop_codon:yes gene_type:complete
MDRLIVRVEFSADGVGRSDWNCDVQNPMSGKPMPVLPSDAVSRAIFHRDEMQDMSPWVELRTYAADRASAIERHFQVCAQKMIAEIEKQEGWPHALSPKEHKNG